jgi:hypothetical protein
LKENIMASTPLEIVQQLLSNPTDPDNVNAHLAPDAKYVSLSSARSFRSGGTWTIQANPDGTTIEV